MSQREKASMKQLLQDAKTQIAMKRIELEPSLIGEVIDLLEDPVRTIKFNAIFVMGEVAGHAGDGLPALVDKLGDPDWSIRRETIRATGKFGKSAAIHAPRLLPFLKDEELTIKEAASVALGNLENGDPAIIAGLVECARDENESVRENAMHALGNIGAGSVPALEALMASLKDTSWGVRQAAARGLSRIGQDAEHAIPVLVHALEDLDWRVRFKVIQTLIRVGKNTVPELLRMVETGSFTAKKCAIEALGELRASDDDVLRVMSRLLTTGNRVVKGKVADALRIMGEPALPVLLNHLRDNPSDVLSIWALGKMDHDRPEIIQVLVNTLQAGNMKAKVEATRSIGNLTHNVDAAVPHLIEIIGGRGAKVLRIEATNTLGKAGCKDAGVERALVAALEDKVPAVRWRAAEALGKLGMTGSIDQLKLLAHDGEDFVASAALEAIDALEK